MPEKFARKMWEDANSFREFTLHGSYFFMLFCDSTRGNDRANI